MYFTAFDSTSGTELWKSNSTAGTTLVQDIFPGSNGSNPRHLTYINGSLYFTAYDGINGKELWESDGTASGTSLVKDIRLGISNYNPSNLINLDGALFFTADDGINGTELWTLVPNKKPTTIILSSKAIAENATGSKVVGTLSTIDPDAGDTHTYTLNTVGYTLNGNAGNDVMNGGAGNDIYAVDARGDRVIEAPNGGFDTVVSTSNYTLGANIEKLTLAGTAVSGIGNNLNNVINGNGKANRLFGLAGNDILRGGDNNDTLYGGTGNDLLNGGAGNDIYAVDATGDRVIEAPNKGFDLVVSTSNYKLGASVERLILTSSAITGAGNNLNNIINGNRGDNRLFGLAGNDRINGGAGNDLLNGGAGRDVLTGGIGADRFVFNLVSEGIDIITDFKRNQKDKILISRKGFGATSTNQFSFNAANGSLLFGGQLIATLQNVDGAGFNPQTDIILKA